MVRLPGTSDRHKRPFRSRARLVARPLSFATTPGSGADLVTAYASSDHDASSDHGSGRGNGSQSYHFHGHFFDQDGVRGMPSQDLRQNPQVCPPRSGLVDRQTTASKDTLFPWRPAGAGTHAIDKIADLFPGLPAARLSSTRRHRSPREANPIEHIACPPTVCPVSSTPGRRAPRHHRSPDIDASSLGRFDPVAARRRPASPATRRRDGDRQWHR